MNLKEPQSHCIDGWATIQKRLTALIISLDQGYVLRSALLKKVDQGSRRELSGMSSGLGSLIWGCQLSNYWFMSGSASLFCHPLFCI